MKKLMLQSATAAILIGGALALTATTASAYVACNNEGECWHTNNRTYDPSLGVVIHPNNWRWGHDDHYRWREHRGHGYWRSGVWITL
jgi:hypothetical protein